MRKRIAQLIEDMNGNYDLFFKRGQADPVLTERIDRELSRYPLRVQTWQLKKNAGKLQIVPRAQVVLYLV